MVQRGPTKRREEVGLSDVAHPTASASGRQIEKILLLPLMEL